MLHRRRGFALGLVLIVMIVLIGLSAVIMDITTNYAGTSRSVVEREELFNAAQSGVEWGKAWLVENREANNLDLDVANDGNQVNNLDEIKATLKDGTIYGDYSYSHSDIDVNLAIYKCNYVPSGTIDPVEDDFPPVYGLYGASGSGSGNSGIGTSGFIDPNRNLLGFGETGSVFVIRSEATFENKSTEIETMVVVRNE